MFLKRHYLLPLAILLLFTTCTKHLTPGTTPAAVRPETAKTRLVASTAQTLFENFESGSKTAYATGSVIFSSGSWTLTDALVGTSSSDAKDGHQSIRIRNTGVLSMNFDLSAGAGAVTISHATYGSDGASSWSLWVSADGGSTYTQTGETITSNSTTLATAAFTVNKTGTLRFQIRKLSGGTNRINIDDITINGSGTTGGATASDNSNLLLGNPSGATNNTSNPDNYLYDLRYYIESYNRDRGQPNWVSWYVGDTSLGTIDRSNDFRPDPNLPAGWYEVPDTAYAGSGFDRGHNCPSADRTNTTAANEATFLMDNMIPQAPNNNEHTWANLEAYGRSLVNAGNEIYVIMGSYGLGGTGSKGTATSVDKNRVAVPSNIWKVILVLPKGNNDLGRITTSTRVIAVNTPNINTISSDWTRYICTVKDIENATGYTLLSNLPDSIRSALEAKKDSGTGN
ncbi:MAG TPA: DNA/RNA non-specific endonuclease [Puia sp.]|jgi:endonuclease G